MQSFAKRIRACRGYRFFVPYLKVLPFGRPKGLPSVAKEVGCYEVRIAARSLLRSGQSRHKQ